IGCSVATVGSGSLELGADENCKLTVAETGKYNFTLNALYVQDEKVEKPVVSVTKSADAPTFGETALYLRGTITSWDTPA
ncbi:hypothetical protein OFN53_40515, partial [Escherichia coli]|nr:hypothetical protein [Escherichia coli]